MGGYLLVFTLPVIFAIAINMAMQPLDPSYGIVTALLEGGRL